jgi:hypothetical protein
MRVLLYRFQLRQGCKKHNPALFFIFMMLSMMSMANAKPQIILPDTIQPQILTVANIIAPPGNRDFYEVTFYQSARFYKLMRNNKNCKTALLLLKQSKKTNKPVLVILTKKFGDVIDQVKKNTK